MPVARLVLSLSLLTILAAGCGDDDSGADTGTDTGTPDVAEDTGMSMELRSVRLSPEGLETLGNGFHYEGWAIIGGAPVSIGKFNIDASETVVMLDGLAVPDATFNVGRDLRDATEFVLTIEGTGDVDIMPSATHLLAATHEGFDTVLMTVRGGTESLGVTFDDVGSFGIGTPTDGPDTNENSGVWFVDFAAPPAASLNLPTLPDGWAYEGWAVIGGQPLSTGRFLDPTMADDFGGYSGEMAGPPVPGEDFLVNAPDGFSFPLDLRGHTIVISVEPSPDDSPAPFVLKPVVGSVPVDAMDHTNYPLTVDTAEPALTLSLLP